MPWMIPSWRSRPIRIRSSMTASRWTARVEPGVLDRDAGVEGEHLDEALVLLAELGLALLVGQVEVADRGAAAADRQAEERAHRRMVGREAVGIGVLRDVRDAVGARLPG